MPPPTSMNTTRPGKNWSKYTRRYSGGRLHGRITKEDIRAAGLRRWDGCSRITTDWVNLYYEPELCFPDGDVLVYLRQPGQSSQGPAFRIHSSVLKARGFTWLLEKVVFRRSIHASQECLLQSCPGCDKHSSTAELYVPAPAHGGLDIVFDYHITTRNFFAWLYNLPLAGRALGKSLIDLKERVEFYRDRTERQLTKKEMMQYAEAQRYLDFRECLDHALAGLLLARVFEEQNLWIDAFTHCVGMSHRAINASLEYPAIDSTTKILISRAREDVDFRMDHVRQSVETFFEHNLSGRSLGLSQAAQEHFDRFRSFLHAFYIEQHGFWPPKGYEKESHRWNIYSTMYADFRNLYHHLVDKKSSVGSVSSNISGTGGICTLQNIQAFDTKHGYETLLRPLPQLPTEPSMSAVNLKSRRRSWNPMIQKKVERETRQTLKLQALIDASDREMSIMDCLLVRRYSHFEEQCVKHDYEHMSLAEGRKVRWILIYAILQNMISVMQSPHAVRNTEGLTYPLCCVIPEQMPWYDARKAKRASSVKSTKSEIVPDINYLEANTSATTLQSTPSVLSRSSTLKKDRRKSMPASTTSVSNETQRPSSTRSSSIKRLVSRTRSTREERPKTASKQNQFCEILIQGYGNGLNEVRRDNSADQHEEITALPDVDQTTIKQSSSAKSTASKEISDDMGHLSVDNSRRKEDVPDLVPSGSGSVSRESSNASSTSTWSFKAGRDNGKDVPRIQDTSRTKSLTSRIASTFKRHEEPLVQDVHIYDEVDGIRGSVHINTKTWDEILGNW